MIKLINNEFKKIGLLKLIISFILFIIVIIVIYEFTDNMKNTIFNLIPFAGILITIIFSSTISGEIENGTFRFYLTKPISRKKIYQSKMVTIIIYMIILMSLILLCYSILCENIDKNYIIKYIKYCSSLLVVNSLVIMLSTFIRSTSVTVGIVTMIIAFSLLLLQIFLDIKLNIVEYTFLPYMDFTLYDDKLTVQQMNELYNINLSIKNGIMINLIYSLLFYKVGETIFIKKDIKN